MISTWQAPIDEDRTSEELLLAFDSGRERRLLVLPALFDEANKMRRFTIDVMRRLDAMGIDCALPDLPGMNESLFPLESVSLVIWRTAAQAAARSFGATSVLTIRAGCVLSPGGLAGWHYAPLSGSRCLRALLRATAIANNEAGERETVETIGERSRNQGAVLAGWPIGAELFRDLEMADLEHAPESRVIEQEQLGSPGLWLRAEPSHDIAQADALAELLERGL